MSKDLVAEVRRELQNIHLTEPVQILEKPSASVPTTSPPSDSGDASTSVSANQTTPLQEPSADTAAAEEPMETSEPQTAAAAADSPTRHNTTVLIMLGMAGSGKTRWTQRFAAHLLSQNKTPYIINLDPACEDPPFPVNIGKFNVKP